MLVVKGTVFDHLNEVYPAFPEFDLRPGLSIAEHSNLHINIGDWEKEIAAMVLGP